MREFDGLEQLFLSKLKAEGFDKPVVWVVGEDVFLTKNKLYLRADFQTASRDDVARVVAFLDQWEPCTLLHVFSEDRCYCTLLMDTFGTEHESDYVESHNAFLHTQPYVEKPVERVSSALSWLWLTRITGRSRLQLSSLDYAFCRRQFSGRSAET